MFSSQEREYSILANLHFMVSAFVCFFFFMEFCESIWSLGNDDGNANENVAINPTTSSAIMYHVAALQIHREGDQERVGKQISQLCVSLTCFSENGKENGIVLLTETWLFCVLCCRHGH